MSMSAKAKPGSIKPLLPVVGILAPTLDGVSSQQKMQMADRNGNYGYPLLIRPRSLSPPRDTKEPGSPRGVILRSPSGRVVVMPRADRLRVVHIAALPGWITLGGLRHYRALPPRAVPRDDPRADAALAPGTLDMDPHEWMTRNHPALTPARAPAARDSIRITSHRLHRTSVRYPCLDTPGRSSYVEDASRLSGQSR